MREAQQSVARAGSCTTVAALKGGSIFAQIFATSLGAGQVDSRSRPPASNAFLAGQSHSQSGVVFGC